MSQGRLGMGLGLGVGVGLGVEVLSQLILFEVFVHDVRWKKNSSQTLKKVVCQT